MTKEYLEQFREEILRRVQDNDIYPENVSALAHYVVLISPTLEDMQGELSVDDWTQLEIAAIRVWTEESMYYSNYQRDKNELLSSVVEHLEEKKKLVEEAIVLYNTLKEKDETL